jgi:hypothetical protein
MPDRDLLPELDVPSFDEYAGSASADDAFDTILAADDVTDLKHRALRKRMTIAHRGVPAARIDRAGRLAAAALSQPSPADADGFRTFVVLVVVQLDVAIVERVVGSGESIDGTALGRLTSFCPRCKQFLIVKGPGHRDAETLLSGSSPVGDNIGASLCTPRVSESSIVHSTRRCSHRVLGNVTFERVAALYNARHAIERSRGSAAAGCDRRFSRLVAGIRHPDGRAGFGCSE